MNRFRWTVVLGAILLAVASGVLAYNAGVSHGLAIAASSSSASGAPAPFGPGPYLWYRPWGFGLFGPFFFVLFWFALFRLFFWGGYRRRWYYRDRDEVPRAFEEWHRRAHERMTSQPAPTEGRA